MSLLSSFRRLWGHRWNAVINQCPRLQWVQHTCRRWSHRSFTAVCVFDIYLFSKEKHKVTHPTKNPLLYQQIRRVISSSSKSCYIRVCMCLTDDKILLTALFLYFPYIYFFPLFNKLNSLIKWNDNIMATTAHVSILFETLIFEFQHSLCWQLRKKTLFF